MTDQVCLARASKEFKISDTVIKRAIESGVISAERREIIAETGHAYCKTFVNREEIAEKLPFLRTGSRFLRIFSEQKKKKPSNPEKQPIYCMSLPKPAIPKLQRKVENPIEPEKPIVKVEGAPVWVSSPCINCRVDCNPETCQKLTDWVMK